MTTDQVNALMALLQQMSDQLSVIVLAIAIAIFGIFLSVVIGLVRR